MEWSEDGWKYAGWESGWHDSLTAGMVGSASLQEYRFHTHHLGRFGKMTEEVVRRLQRNKLIPTTQT